MTAIVLLNGAIAVTSAHSFNQSLSLQYIFVYKGGGDKFGSKKIEDPQFFSVKGPSCTWNFGLILTLGKKWKKKKKSVWLFIPVKAFAWISYILHWTKKKKKKKNELNWNSKIVRVE